MLPTATVAGACKSARLFSHSVYLHLCIHTPLYVNNATSRSRQPFDCRPTSTAGEIPPPVDDPFSRGPRREDDVENVIGRESRRWVRQRRASARARDGRASAGLTPSVRTIKESHRFGAIYLSGRGESFPANNRLFSFSMERVPGSFFSIYLDNVRFLYLVCVTRRFARMKIIFRGGAQRGRA